MQPRRDRHPQRSRTTGHWCPITLRRDPQFGPATTRSRGSAPKRVQASPPGKQNPAPWESAAQEAAPHPPADQDHRRSNTGQGHACRGRSLAAGTLGDGPVHILQRQRGTLVLHDAAQPRDGPERPDMRHPVLNGVADPIPVFRSRALRTALGTVVWPRAVIVDSCISSALLPCSITNALLRYVVWESFFLAAVGGRAGRRAPPPLRAARRSPGGCVPALPAVLPELRSERTLRTGGWE